MKKEYRCVVGDSFIEKLQGKQIREEEDEEELILSRTIFFFNSRKIREFIANL